MERLRQRIAECGETIADDELIMHILYHLPSEYDNLNDQYLKDLDDEKAMIWRICVQICDANIID